MPEVVTVEGGIIRILGVPVVWTNKMDQGSVLIGDFTRGSLLLIRDDLRFEAFTQDQYNVIKNLITFRLEERIALAIFGAEDFIVGGCAVES